MYTTLKKAKHWFLYSKKYRKFINNLSLVKLTKIDFEKKNIKQEVFDTYRDIFGHGNGEWGEYVKCTSCRNVYDIEKIHGLEEYVHLSDLPTKLSLSSCCNAPLIYFHDEDSLERKFNILLNKSDTVMYVLKDESIKKIVGLIIGCIDTVDVVWNEHIKDKLILKNKKLPDFFLSKERVVYIDELGIIKTHRQGNVPLFTQLRIFLTDIKKLGGAEEILFWTSEHSKLYKLIQQLPHRIILKDLQVPPRVVVGIPFKKTYKKVRLAHMVYT